MSMADAWAQAAGRVGVANLHVGPGLGNGMGSLYNAWEGRTPLVVTAGQQDTRFRLREPVLWHDLVAMAAPVTKWSVQAESAGELPELLHRAFKIARDPPTGPVFVALPFNVMNERTSRGPIPPSRIWRRAGPDPDGVAEAARLILGAARPVLFAGDRVAQSGAAEELIALAERIGADVYGEVLPVQVNAPSGHPCVRARGFGDHRPGAGRGRRRRPRSARRRGVLRGGVVRRGCAVPGGRPGHPDRPVRAQISAATTDSTAASSPIRSSPSPSLTPLSRTGRTMRTGPERAARMERIRGARRRRCARSAPVRSEPRPATGRCRPPGRCTNSRGPLPRGVAVAREAITADRDLARSFDFRAPGDAIGSRGGGIGQGLPTGIGLKLARPERPVLCVSGDGSALYTIQALWTAAHHRIPVVFVILNNRVYRILKYNMDRFRAVAGIKGRAGSYVISTSPTRTSTTCRWRGGFGVEGRRVRVPRRSGRPSRRRSRAGRPVSSSSWWTGRSDASAGTGARQGVAGAGLTTRSMSRAGLAREVRRRLLAGAAAVALLAPGRVSAGGLPEPVAEALERHRLPAESLSVWVQDAAAPDETPLVSHRPDVPRNPASTIKLITTLAALEELGPDYEWETRVYVTGPVRAGRLDGDLVLVGSGDPLPGGRAALAALAAVRARGLETVAGRLVIDNTRFSVAGEPPPGSSTASRTGRTTRRPMPSSSTSTRSTWSSSPGAERCGRGPSRRWRVCGCGPGSRSGRAAVRGATFASTSPAPSRPGRRSTLPCPSSP